jgi:hypothetical protein
LLGAVSATHADGISGSVQLKLLTASIVAKDGVTTSGSVSCTFKHLVASGALTHSMPNYGSVGVVLPLLTVSAWSTIPIVLPKMVVSGELKKGIDASGVVRVVLPFINTRVAALNLTIGLPPSIVLISSPIRGNGSGLFQFNGPANKYVSWIITVGSGNIMPMTNLTDKYGRAFAKYDAGGYVGPLGLEVDYEP